MRKMFSENQIKNIVNQGIESGEISGGTKLYKHELNFEFNDSTNLVTPLWIISNVKESYADLFNEYHEVMIQPQSGLIMATDEDNNTILIQLYIYIDNDHPCVDISCIDSSFNLSQQEFSSISDGVTPL